VHNGANVFLQGAIETFHNAIKLWCVIYGKFSCHLCFCQVLIECLAQIFATMVRAQDFDTLTVLLGIGLSMLQMTCTVCFEGLILGPHEVSNGVPYCIVH
jgi:hypothetical protein